MKRLLLASAISLVCSTSSHAADNETITCDGALSENHDTGQSIIYPSKDMHGVTRIHTGDPLPPAGTPYQYIEMLPENMKSTHDVGICMIDKSLNDKLSKICTFDVPCRITGTVEPCSDGGECVLFKKIDLIKSYR
jgi:hypothetical protein